MSGRQSNKYSTIVSMRTPDVVGSRTVMSWSSPGRDCNYINNRDQQVVLSNSTPGRPSLNRGQSQIQQALSGSARFMGLGKNEDGEEERNRWDAKRMRFLSRNYGLCDSHAGKQDPAAAICMSDFPHTSNSPADIQRADTMAAVEQVCHGVTPSVFFGSATYARSQSNESRARLDRRDSAIRVVYDSISSFITRGKIAVPKQRRVPLTSRCSFDIDLFDGVASSSVNSDVIEQPPCLVQQGTDIHHDTTYHIPKGSEPSGTSSIFKESSSDDKVTSKDGEFDTYVRRPMDLSLSGKPIRAPFSPQRLEKLSEEVDDITKDPNDEKLFYNEDASKVYHESTVPTVSAKPRLSIQSRTTSTLSEEVFFEFTPTAVPRKIRGLRVDSRDSSLPVLEDNGKSNTQAEPGIDSKTPDQIVFENKMDVAQPGQRSSVQITEPHLRRLVNEKSIDKVREQQIMDSILNSLIQSGATPRRARVRGIGVFGALCNRRLGRRKVGKLDPEIRDLIESGSDERPWFTWWVTVVQVVVCLVSILSYGIGPVGWDRVERKDEVMDVSLTLRQVSYYEPANLWIGPKFKDLIRLGAKYSPCMRRERGLWREIQEDRSRENHTGCCVFNDRTGCYQTGQSSCPRSLATWHKWSKPLIRQQSKFDPFIQKNKNGEFLLSTVSHSWRMAGAVCGQDPEYCANPPSVDPYHWPDDLTRWPICLETRTGAFLPAHMSCQITGRPCCIQLQGQCRIATKEYCSFVQGYWHENATLCSQVNCFSDVCGMLPFLGRDRPDQFYRLFIALFLHAGIIHCAITVFIQLWLMRDLEKLIGWLRMAILYIGSGIGGNLASAIFVPYNPEVGPSGCQLGILAALLVDVFHHRRIIDNPSTAYRDHALVMLGLFASGILPWIDNWAHLFGFIFGLLLTIITFPYLDFAPKEVNRGWLWTSITRRHVAVIISVVLCTLLYFILGYIFFKNIEVDCPWCEYFNCVNINIGSDHFCDNRGQKLTQWLPI